MDTNLNPKGSIEFGLFYFEPPNYTINDIVMKYEKPSKVLLNCDKSLKPLIEKMMKTMNQYDDRELVIDYKVRSLKDGDKGSGIYGYHLDCCNDIWDNFFPETHLIYSTVIGTKFIQEPLDISGCKSIKEVLDKSNFTQYNAPVNWVHKYTSKVLHSCPIMESDCQRILIRVTAGFKDRIKHAKYK